MEGMTTPRPPGRGLTYAGVVIAVVALILGILSTALPLLRGPTTRTFLLSSDLVNASNRWFPSNLVAYAGDTVEFNVTNRGMARHGFQVEGLTIAGLPAELNPGANAVYRAANVPAGLYRYFCHLHPTHIGGQLLVVS